jgi:outer membrane receptor protein involved in Fe transport
VVPTAQLAAFNAVANASPAVAPLLLTACGGSMRTGTTAATGNPLAPLGVFLDPADGIPVDLKGKRLPNAAKYTINLGAQYIVEMGNGWQILARADYYKQGNTYSRIYNSLPDKVRGYENLNLTLQLNNPDLGWQIEGFVKNATDETSITDVYLTDDSSGLFRNIFVTEPRLYGIAVSKSF